MTLEVEGEEEQTSVVEVKVVEIPYLVVEEEENQISGVDMTVTIMETMIGITTVAAPIMANGIITTITMANVGITITPPNWAITITITHPEETSETYQIPSQRSWIRRHILRWQQRWDLF